MNTFYLRTLRETIWPDDVLSTESRPNYTDREKEDLKKQAARCLGNFLPGMNLFFKFVIVYCVYFDIELLRLTL